MPSPQAEFLEAHKGQIDAIVSNIGRILADDVLVIEQPRGEQRPVIASGAYTAEDVTRQFPEEDYETAQITAELQNRTELSTATIQILGCRSLIACNPDQFHAVYKSVTRVVETEEELALSVSSTELFDDAGRMVVANNEVQSRSNDGHKTLIISTVHDAHQAVDHRVQFLDDPLSKKLFMQLGNADTRKLISVYLIGAYSTEADLNNFLREVRQDARGTATEEEISHLIETVRMQAVFAKEGGKSTHVYRAMEPTTDELEEYIELTTIL